MLVIQSYAEKGQNEDILKYLDPVMRSIDRKLKQYSANAALDAVAAHFDAAAEEQETEGLIQHETEAYETNPEG
jgi:hypothetical protein